MNPCISLPSVAMTNTLIKSNLGRKCLFQLTLSGHNPSLREVRAGTQGRSRDRNYSLRLLAGLLPGSVHWISYTASPTCLGIVPTLVGWALTHQSSIKRIPYRCGHKQVFKKVPSSQVNLGCVKVTVKSNQYIPLSQK